MKKYSFPFPSFALLLSLFLIFVLGMIMIFNTTAAEILDSSQQVHVHRAPLRHFLIAVAGGIVARLICFLGYRSCLRLGRFLFLLNTFFLALVFVPGIGKQVNGALRWISLFGLTWQPSECLQYVLPLYYIESIRRNPRILSHFAPFFHFVGIVFIPLLLILLEPNNSALVVMGLILLQLFFISGARKMFWLWPLFFFLCMGSIAAVKLPYVASRIEVFLHPERDLKGKGHQPYQAKIAAGSGKIWGKGLGQSIQKFSYLPEAQNDYIAAIFAEEMGFAGMLVLILLYAAIAYFGLSISHFAYDREGLYLASSVTFILSIQAFLNLAVVSGLFPSTGLNLPFFSQGGTNLIANCAGVGLLLSVARGQAEGREKKQARTAPV